MDQDETVLVDGVGHDVLPDTLGSLQSKQQLDLLNAMDQLRTHGVSEYIDLPQLVVCGDQSAGKSSVLEAISEVPFPRKEGTCTRFATQIVLRRAEHSGALVNIIPAKDRPQRDLESFKNFHRPITDMSELPVIISEAEDLILRSKNNSKAFARDVLNVEISGPGQPHLTLVDLPGLVHTLPEGQEGDVQLIKELVTGYMEEERTIILAVVSALNEYNLQAILTLAREYDPQGKRSIGIITKPDLPQNKEIPFHLGWHVLKNRGFGKEREYTTKERNEAEQSFFEKGVWKSLPREDVGVISLRSKLSRMLYEHIKKELPKVRREIASALRECEDELDAMGESRRSPYEQRRFLSMLSNKFQQIVRAGVDGNYEDDFFDDAEVSDASPEKFTRRLRAKVQKLNSSFAQRMHRKGHLKKISGRNLTESRPSSPTTLSRRVHKHKSDQGDAYEPEQISYDEAIEWVRPNLDCNRGRELQGTFNPLLIGTMFRKQSQKWNDLAQEHVTVVHRACMAFVRVVVNYTSTDDVAQVILSRLYVMLEKRYEDANKELAKITASLKGQPITYNHYFSSAVQEARSSNDIESYKEKILNSCVERFMSFEDIPRNVQIDKDKLLAFLVRGPSFDMEDFACNEVLQNMLAYYKVALKKFIDDLATAVVERHLLHGLPDIFSPMAVAEMSDAEVQYIAEESSSTRRHRTFLENKREGLKKGLEVCRNAMPGLDFVDGTDNVPDLLTGYDDPELVKDLKSDHRFKRASKANAQPIADAPGPASDSEVSDSVPAYTTSIKKQSLENEKPRRTSTHSLTLHDPIFEEVVPPIAVAPKPRREVSGSTGMVPERQKALYNVFGQPQSVQGY